MLTNVIFFIFTLFSIISGIRFGYLDSHTPPPQFLISSLLLILGLILIALRKLLFKNKLFFRIHLVLIVINLIIILSCFILPII